MEADTADSAPGLSVERDPFIPVRKSDIVAALLDKGGFEHPDQNEDFHALCRMLGAIYHFTYFDQLERLRADYYYFNPELDPHARCEAAALERSYIDLKDALDTVLRAANFVEVSHEEIERAHRERAEMRVALKTPLGDFREVRFFRRGHHRQTFTISEYWGLRKRDIEYDVYDDVVLFVVMKPPADIRSRREMKRLSDRKIRPGSVMIKYFRNIASADLNALFPNVRVVMSNMDKLVLTVPAIAGGVPIVMNLLSTLSVLFLVAGFYLGISGAVQESEVKKALAALSGLVALGGFLAQQWVKYQRQSLKYHKLLNDNIYFRNINNNAGIFDYLIGAAEEQECKEAFLAYHFLLHAKTPPAQGELDAAIESWLNAHFGIDVDFEVSDALAKLERLGLLRRDGEKLSVMPLKGALARLDIVWDDFFRAEMKPQPV